MQKRLFTYIPLFTIALLIISLSKVSAESVTASGKRGGSNVYSAEPVTKSAVSFGYQQEYFRSNRIQVAGNNNFYGNQFFFNYAPFDSIQLFLNHKIFRNHNAQTLQTLQSLDFTRSEAGTLVSLPLSTHYFIGVEPSYILFNGNGSNLEGSSFGIRLLNTFKTVLSPKNTLKLHLNSQYFYDQSSKITETFNFSFFERKQLYGIATYKSIHHGLGVEFEMPYVSPYVEYTLDQLLKSHLSFFKNPNRLTLGTHIAFKEASPWTLNIGTDAGISHKLTDNRPPTPHWNVFAALSFADIPAKIIAPSLPIEIKKEEVKKEEVKEPEILEPQVIVPQQESMVVPIYPILEGTVIETPISQLLTWITLTKFENKNYPIYALKPKKKKSIVNKTVIPVTTPVAIKEKEQSNKSKTPVFIDTPALKPETRDVVPSQDLNKNFSEEEPNKNFLIHFR
ncbi:MAG: hypothetical protein A2Z91_05535 [Deltaproteobacteria bacterium GWA2_38_16]|nr:MAG: hypothetical protein A2Z91_05535 [Deltaproteobacteria bacterium GWA2_38_16]OGQ03238.1 MAG: hypothetical protein A3D19_04260 [Deltaproteobacteria bacterium RIFCSPHIGHO2_02_FULL_38_15]OGQ34991.1 MAG: hypothetical protein A3A72_03310 [Deltaproteobacteria bacterium RIFCSPLOWO2_01_FULL_38_9]OGQ58756.1 MAG: hypothetical protein A3G92_04185 [Deltaproteobacteria bacterium RIFCSPLOWO2_12_FULL_38_8]HBQ21835.1 hypothetical protein [Deltaproteobacteria bacterium]